jgi:hypothetical protein
MRIGIKNNNNFVHTVCRTNGTKMQIPAKGYIVIDTDNEQEISYWTNINKSVTDKIGIEVLTNDLDIVSLEISHNNIKSDVSIVDSAASPVARQIAESTYSNNNNSDSVSKDNFYTKEQLLDMDKEDLINICNNFNIKYRKNSSVKTLVKLILGSDAI